MRSYSPQYPHSSNRLNPSPSPLFFFPFAPPSTFPLLSIFFFHFSSFSFWSFSISFLSFVPDPPLRFSLILFFPFPFFFNSLSFFWFFGGVCACIFLCMCVRIWQSYVYRPMITGVKQIKSNIRYVLYKKINQIK